MPYETEATRDRRFQFILWSLILIIVCDLGSFWLILPTERASQFVEALENGDSERAESMFASRDKEFPGQYVTKKQKSLLTVEVKPSSLEHLWRGERFVKIYVPYGPEMYTFDNHLTFRVTRWDTTLIHAWR